MVAVFSENLKVYNAEQFKESVSEAAQSRLYLTFGRAYAWANDAAPQQANSSVSAFNEVWDNMIGAKLITGFDIAHVIPRNNWTANTVYQAYDHCTCSLRLFDSNTKFYVVTSDWNVYKCLSNNMNGVASTVMPTSINTNAAQTEIDGYTWKYMYTIPPSDRLKFTTDHYIPVKTLTINDNSLQWQVQENAVPGSIDNIKITNPGQNYTDANNIIISITGDGTGAQGIATVNTMTNTIASIVMTNRGRDYTYATATIGGSTGGSNGALRVIISPPGGHGSDALRELGGAYLLLNPRLMGTENGKFDVDNEYRQISIIKDPLYFETSNVAGNTVISQLTVLTLNGTSNEYVEDEFVYQGASLETSTFSGRVVAWDSANSLIKLSNVKGAATTNLLTGQNSGASRFVVSVTNPDLQTRSGQLIYIDNMSPIQRDLDQVEDFKIVLKF